MKVDGERGTSVAELAICLPLLLLVALGIIEFGFILYDQAMITNASREGARAGIVFNHPDRIPDDRIKEVARSYCIEHVVSLGNTSSIPTVNVARGGSNPGDPLTVTVTYPYTFLILPNVNRLIKGHAELPADITLTAQTVMRLE